MHTYMNKHKKYIYLKNIFKTSLQSARARATAMTGAGDGDGRGRGDGEGAGQGRRASGQGRRAATTSGEGAATARARATATAGAAGPAGGVGAAWRRRCRRGVVRGNREMKMKFFTSVGYIPRALVPVRGTNRNQCTL